MVGMFQGATSFAGGIATWDVSSVTDMSSMFSGATSFNEDLSRWQVSSLISMDSMFEGAIAFNHSLCSWSQSLPSHTLSVTNMFRNSGCPVTDDPGKAGTSSGPFCHDCVASEAPSTSPTLSTPAPTPVGPTPSPSLRPTQKPSTLPTEFPTSQPTLAPTDTPEAGFLPHCIDPDNLECSELPLLLETCTTKVVGMTFFYSGAGCEIASVGISSKDPSYECVDRNGGPPGINMHDTSSFIVVTDSREKFAFFRDWVYVGSTFSLDDRGFGFGIHQRIKIYNSSDTSPESMLQEVVYHSYICSGTFDRDDYIGSLQLVSLVIKEEPSLLTEVTDEVDSALFFSTKNFVPFVFFICHDVPWF